MNTTPDSSRWRCRFTAAPTAQQPAADAPGRLRPPAGQRAAAQGGNPRPALPFASGWAIGGTWQAALLARVWARLVRIFVLQHVTWSVNSLRHMFGNRPFTTRRHDRATNLWPLAVLSLGESWHNMHHSDPACARHGVDRGQIDLSAGLIRALERIGWASSVRWPVSARLDQHRRPADDAAGHVLP